MKVRAAFLVMFLGLSAIAPVFAQNAVGGPKKQGSVGGAVKQTSPVIPASKGGSTPVAPPPKVSSIPVTPSPQVKCPAPPCAAKESHR
jgi:hypothetical protein